MDENQTPFDEFLNCDYALIGDFLFNLSGFEYAVIGTILGIVISSKLSINQQNSIGNFLELVGQILLSISSQEYNRLNTQNNNARYQDNNNNDLIDRLNKLEAELNKIKRANM